MAKNKKSDGRTPFTIAAVMFGLLIAASVGLFIFSTVISGKTSQKFNESMYPVKYEYYVETYAKEYNVDVCLIYGVIRTESGFDPEAVSQAGAIGLMQIMPDTFTWLQNYRTEFMPEKLLDADELYKPQVNIEYGTYMLRYLLDHYDGDKSLAIIAYNAGYGNVDNWLSDGTIPKSGVTSADVPFTETANYVTRVTEAMEMYRTLYYDELEYYTGSDGDEQTSAQTFTSSEEIIPEETDTGYTEYEEEPSESGNYDDYSDDYYGDYDNTYAFEGDGTGVGYWDEEEW